MEQTPTPQSSPQPPSQSVPVVAPVKVPMIPQQSPPTSRSAHPQPQPAPQPPRPEPAPVLSVPSSRPDANSSAPSKPKSPRTPSDVLRAQIPTEPAERRRSIAALLRIINEEQKT